MSRYRLIDEWADAPLARQHHRPDERTELDEVVELRRSYLCGTALVVDIPRNDHVRTITVVEQPRVTCVQLVADIHRVEVRIVDVVQVAKAPVEVALVAHTPCSELGLVTDPFGVLYLEPEPDEEVDTLANQSLVLLLTLYLAVTLVDVSKPGHQHDKTDQQHEGQNDDNEANRKLVSVQCEVDKAEGRNHSQRRKRVEPGVRADMPACDALVDLVVLERCHDDSADGEQDE